MHPAPLAFPPCPHPTGRSNQPHHSATAQPTALRAPPSVLQPLVLGPVLSGAGRQAGPGGRSPHMPASRTPRRRGELRRKETIFRRFFSPSVSPFPFITGRGEEQEEYYSPQSTAFPPRFVSPSSFLLSPHLSSPPPSPPASRRLSLPPQRLWPRQIKERTHPCRYVQLCSSLVLFSSMLLVVCMLSGSRRALLRLEFWYELFTTEI